MALQNTYNIENPLNYIFDTNKIEIVGSIGKLKPIVSGAAASLYWKLDENRGLVAIDSSGNGNHGAFQGGLDQNDWTESGKINSAIEGKGSGYINGDDILNFERTNTFSLECWVAYTSSGSQIVIGKQINSGQFQGYTISLAGGKARFLVRDNAGKRIQLESTNVLNDGNFYHIVGTYDGSGVVGGANLYVNNNIENNILFGDTLTGSLISTANFQLSGRDGNNNPIATSTIPDECLVYDRELSPAEVAFRYNSGAGTQQIPGASTSFATDNPSLRPKLQLSVSELTGFFAAIVAAGLDSITFTINLNAIRMYYNTGTSQWEASSGYPQTNTASEILANLSSLIILFPTTYSWEAFLHSDDGTTTPELDDVITLYEFEGGAIPTANTCLVFGYIYDNADNPLENVRISAELELQGNYSNEIIVPEKIRTTITNSSGYWELSLVENENMTIASRYKFIFDGSGFKDEFFRSVPNVVTKNFAELT